MHDRKQTKLLVRAREICITCGRRIAEQGEKKCEEKEDVLQCSQRLQAFPLLLSAVSDVCVTVQQCTSFQSVMCVLAKPEQKENVKNLFFSIKKRDHR